VEEEMVRQGLMGLPAIALLALLALVFPVGCANRIAPSPLPTSEPPSAPREFRAAWVATVANIDWPSSRGLSTDAQQAEAREIISRARSLGLNALIFQVRPAADALYASALEPWSEYLSGEQGKPPEPFYDPLAFWIEESHRAGLELHAWFNPYRARHPSAKSPLAENHVAKVRPELVKTYGDHLWLDPGEPAAQEQVLAVIRDIVRRYEVDGVHFDDYFYPYPIKDESGLKVDFPDGPSWKVYSDAGGTLACADWRRRNVDAFVERCYREVHLLKPHLRVGVSPFGLGRPDRRPPGITGFSQYDELYANVELWLEQGWLDYLAPQLYWKIDSTGQPFEPLLEYWRSQNSSGRHVWPGLFTSQAGAATPWPALEITRQIQLTRAPAASLGHVHFSMVALKKNYSGIAEALAESYPTPALVPASPWLGGVAPAAPTVNLSRSGAASIRLDVTSGAAPWLLTAWGRYGSTWRFFVLPGGTGTIPEYSGKDGLDLVFVSTLGPTGLESPRVPAIDQRY
jgi:uncharacterized lipoprotein YddW (UPF0748 family)